MMVMKSECDATDGARVKELQIVKGKVVLVLNQGPRLEDVWGSGGITLGVLKLETRWR
jgi:hypothetical protein